jgi:hypothetical protein
MLKEREKEKEKKVFSFKQSIFRTVNIIPGIYSRKIQLQPIFFGKFLVYDLIATNSFLSCDKNSIRLTFCFNKKGTELNIGVLGWELYF